MHQLENNFLKITAREYGAELTSLFDKKNNIEHLWQADPAYWGWHAPVLFPVVGRCIDDEINIGGLKYKMEKHGFARKATFKLLDLSSTSMVFSLTDDEKLHKIYPYKFEFLIGYKLDDNTLTISYEVVNRNKQRMLFSLGGHPAFSVPFNKSSRYEDYYLEFEKTENAWRHYIDSEGFFNGKKELVLANTNVLPLKPGMFINDALIFKELQSRGVAIRDKNSSNYLSVNFNGFNYLGLWAKTGATYVCIEPWLGCADTAGKPTDFEHKEGVMALDAGGKFNVSFSITAG